MWRCRFARSTVDFKSKVALEEPTYDSRRIFDELQLLGYNLGRERSRWLMRITGIEPINPKPRLSIQGKHKKYLDLLGGLEGVQ